MNASGGQRKFDGCGPAAVTPLFDDLVGAGEDRRWDRQTERVSGFAVDDQLEICRLHDGQIGRLGAVKDFAG